jgi:RNA polymerase sigma-70 factor (ECF subfamily)
MAKECPSTIATPVATVSQRDKHNAATRIAAMFDEHFVSVWRFLRRMGVPTGDVDDYAQEVMLIATRKLSQIELGKERGFLLGAAWRVASDARRTHAHRRETDDDQLQERQDPAPDPEMLTNHLRARQVLDQVLDEMPLDFRSVFVLSEIDELSMAEIAELLQIPAGTVASRLRRGRECFDARVKRIQAQFVHREGQP